jgi:hypothetical protein
VVATTKLLEPIRDPEPAAGAPWWHGALLFGIVCLGVAIILTALASTRGVNADEGFYLLAGWRVLGGQRPYADFFFPQMPYLPYVEAPVLALTGPSLFAGRAISVASAALLAGTLAVAAARRSERVLVGILVALAYATNALVLSYLTISKTYGLANLTMVVAFVLVDSAGAGLLSSAVGGACAAIAVGTRLPSFAVLVVLMLWSTRRGLRHGLAFAVGALLLSLPWIWLLAQDPQGFWFGNVEFHALRREIAGLGPILMQKVGVLAKWVLLPQNFILWVAAAVGCWLRPRLGVLPGLCAVALAAGYLAATPTYLEYMVQIVPFLLLCSVPAFVAVLDRRAALLAATAVYLIGLIVARRAAPEETLRGSKAQLWQLRSVRAVAAYLQERSEPGDRILSWWEGYPLLAQREGFAGVGFWESNAAKKLAPDVRRRFHLLHRDDIRDLVDAREPRLIVFPKGTWSGLEDVVARHYRPAAHFGAIQVFELREASADDRIGTRAAPPPALGQSYRGLPGARADDAVRG